MIEADSHDELVRLAEGFRKDRLIDQDKLKEKYSPLFSKISSQEKQMILNCSVVQLVRMLNEGKYDSVGITATFIQQCLKHGFRLNNATQNNFQEALETAKACDVKRKQSGLKNWTFSEKTEKSLPPLFGIPISIKDSIRQKNFACTQGCIKRKNCLEKQDGFLLAKLRNAGAIPFVRSNIPQSGMTIQAPNRLYGRAQNPWNTSRTTGGSSGGQGGLISSRCSPLGFGSDIGGSIRVPSQFCGVFGLKATADRIPFQGHTQIQNIFGGLRGIPCVMGPLAKSSEDLALFMKVLSDPAFEEGLFNPDPYFKMMPFDDKKYNLTKKYRIGYFQTTRHMPSAPANRRAVRQAVKAAKDLGHQLIQFQIPYFQQALSVFTKIITSYGTDTFTAFPSPEKPIQEYGTAITLLKAPNCLISCLAGIIGCFQPRAAQIARNSKSMTAYELNKVLALQRQLQRKLHADMKKANIQFIICPGFAISAFKHGMSKDALPTGAYQMIWNVFRNPVGSMPITIVRQDQQIYDNTWNDLIEQAAGTSQQGCKGMPAGIQIAGTGFEEQSLLGLMSSLESAIGFYKKNKFPL